MGIIFLLIYLTVIGFVVWSFIKVWSAWIILVGFLALFAISIVGLKNFLIAPREAIGYSLECVEYRWGGIMVLALPLAVLAVGLALVIIMGGIK